MAQKWLMELLPVLMWMHHKMAVRPTPMTNEAKAMPTVTSVDTPTTMTWALGPPSFWVETTGPSGGPLADDVAPPDAAPSPVAPLPIQRRRAAEKETAA
jgi:hypothetical protein